MKTKRWAWELLVLMILLAALVLSASQRPSSVIDDCPAVAPDTINVFNNEGEIIDVLHKGTHTSAVGRIEREWVVINENATLAYVPFGALIIEAACFYKLRPFDMRLPAVSADLLTPIR